MWVIGCLCDALWERKYQPHFIQQVLALLQAEAEIRVGPFDHVDPCRTELSCFGISVGEGPSRLRQSACEFERVDCRARFEPTSARVIEPAKAWPAVPQ
jgi:hypothetical protein